MTLPCLLFVAIATATTAAYFYEHARNSRLEGRWRDVCFAAGLPKELNQPQLIYRRILSLRRMEEMDCCQRCCELPERPELARGNR